MNNVMGLIGLSTEKGNWISNIIKWFRKSVYSHTFVVFGKLGNSIIIGESTAPHIRLAPIEKYLNIETKFELWKLANIEEKKLDEAVTKMMPYTGMRYGYISLLGFVWVWLCEKIAGDRVDNPIDSNKIIVCTKYLAYFCKYIGYDPIAKFNPSNVAPDTVSRALKGDLTAKLVGVSEYGSSEIKWLEQ